MTKLRTTLSLIGYGLLLWIVAMIVQVLISMRTASYDTLDTWWGNGIVAIVAGAASYLFSRTLHPANRKQAAIHGAVMAGVILVIAALLVIANGWQTTFGNWSFYLVFIGIVAGPLFMKPAKKPTP